MKGTAQNRREFLKSVGTGGVAATLAGCTGASDGDSGGQAETTADEESSEARPTTAGRSGEDTEFVFAVTQVFGTIDPAKQTDYTEGFAAQNFYDPFVTTDPESFEPVGHLVTDWTTEDDGRTWVFSLREDVPHQNGGTLTAEDVVYSMNRILSIGEGPASNWTGQLESGEDIVARDEYTVEFSLGSSYGPLLASLNPVLHRRQPDRPRERG